MVLPGFIEKRRRTRPVGPDRAPALLNGGRPTAASKPRGSSDAASEARAQERRLLCRAFVPTLVIMDDLLSASLRVIAALNREQVDYVVIGGVAMNLHGLVRATEDLDLFVRPEASNIERLRAALRSVWEDPDIEEITADDLCGDFPAVRYGPPTGSLYLDILTRLGDLARFEDLEVCVVDIEGVAIRVASPRTLRWLKKDTVRAVDHADAEALRRVFGLDDEV